MPKATTPKESNTVFYVAIVILILAILAIGYLYMSSNTALTSANSNYSALKASSQSQVSALQNQLASNKSLYQNAESNLTTPYTEVLYVDHTVSLPRYNYTYTYNYLGYNYSSGLYDTYTYNYTVTWGRFNFSFNAPYPGYFVLNATSTLANIASPSTCMWGFDVVSNKIGWRNVSTTKSTIGGTTYIYTDRYPGTDGLFVNLTQEPASELCPLQFITYHIPVNKGENYVLIDNDNSTSGATITFSLKYVGFHTS